MLPPSLSCSHPTLPLTTMAAAAAAAAVLPLLFLLLSLLPSSSASPDTPSLLLLLRSSPLDPRGVLHLPTALPPCRWLGVQCSASSRVTRLVLESLDLRGSLPSPLPRLDELRLLSLKNNSLSGALPDLSPFPNLKSLFLSHNSFSGALPPSLPLLPRLRSLDLSHNNLSGPLPPSLALLQSLAVLRLDSNSLSGPVPPFNQSSLKSLNLSRNSLSGPVPVTPLLLAFGAPALDANPALCGLIVRRECRDRGEFFRNSSDRTPAATTESPITADGGNLEQIRLPPGVSGPSRWTRRRRVLTAGLTAIGVLLVALLGVGIAMRKHKRVLDPRKGTEAAAAAADALERGGDGACDANGGNAGSCELAAAASLSEERVRKLGKSGCLVFCAGEAAVYSLEQLMRASAELLGRGTVGTTYKAVLDNRLIVSVKRVDAGRMGTAGKEEFERHMEMVGRLRHPNLVALRAYFQAKEERLLVYDYQPNGSLFSLIHGSRSTRAKPLHWTSCLKIAEDVAQGLAYIHQASRLVHGNIKSSNILLGSDFEACLTDSCLASLVEPPNGEAESGYRAPETRNSNRNLTPKSDIYAFGILLLELLTGKPPLPQPFLVATDLPVWVRSVREDDGCEDERLMMLLDIVRECIRSVPESRPSTWQVLKMIQEVKESDVGDDVDPTDIP